MHEVACRSSLTAAGCILSIAVAGCMPAPPSNSLCIPPRPRKVVVVIEENHGYSEIVGNPDAPYINRLVREGANFAQSRAVTHPSQPNYLALFSGSTQGVLDDAAHPHELFTSPNLGSKLLEAGLTFAGYSESQPETGFDGASAGEAETGFYRRKHNPWVNWQVESMPLPPNKLPPSSNLSFIDFPSTFENLPTLSFVVPNQKHDMHDGTIAEADAWLEQNIGPYVEWSHSNNGLLILTWDEDDGPELNHIVTVFNGQTVRSGDFSESITHYDVLRTLEEMFDLPHDEGTVSAAGVPCNAFN